MALAATRAQIAGPGPLSLARTRPPPLSAPRRLLPSLKVTRDVLSICHALEKDVKPSRRLHSRTLIELNQRLVAAESPEEILDLVVLHVRPILHLLMLPNAISTPLSY